MNHDIVTIGGSAGSIEVLLEIVRDLPADLAAAVFVVTHMSPNHVSALPDLLAQRGAMPAKHPLHDEPIRPGTIYVAPPDMHVQVAPGRIEVVRGPKDNGFRPSVDVLFRTASAGYGSRVIGVVLSGFQDCGTAGMLSIKARGGLTVVQDPASATAAAMPKSVVDNVEVDHVVHPLELPGLLVRLVAAPAGPREEPAAVIHQLEGEAPGQPADIVCPICDGVLTETHPGVFQHFRCHVGHAFSLEALVREQSEELERALWAAVRSLEESARISRRIALTESGSLRARMMEKADAQQSQADYLRRLLVRADRLSPQDAVGL